MARRLSSVLIEKNMDKLGGIVEVDEGSDHRRGDTP